MSQSISIDFRLLVFDDILPVDELLANPQRLVDYYLDSESNTDSAFQGGYCITIDDVKWNANPEFYFDMFFYTLNWLKGINQILKGEVKEAEIGFWEESSARATLISKNELRIEDRNAVGQVLGNPAVVDLKLFCEALVAASRKYVQLADTIKVMIESDKSISETKAKQIIDEMCGEEFLMCTRDVEESLRLASI